MKSGTGRNINRFERNFRKSGLKSVRIAPFTEFYKDSVVMEDHECTFHNQEGG